MRALATSAAALLLSGVTAFAQPGLGPVYQDLQHQGFTQMHSYHQQSWIWVTARRGDALREMVYDARTGRLLWDSMDPHRDRSRDAFYMHSYDQLGVGAQHAGGCCDNGGGAGHGMGSGNGGSGGMGGGMGGN